MTTNLGRVVYDRKPHLFKISDVARIFKSMTFEETPDVFSKIFSGLLITYIFNAGLTIELISWTLKEIIQAVLESVCTAFLVGVILEDLKEYLEDPTRIPETSA